ncbi:MAG TPA: hypothetical protein VNL96_00735 [Gemmatimonadaceae bacterium]|nr:hypothetical protein [Gemmatimonadaceae bacterium]
MSLPIYDYAELPSDERSLIERTFGAFTMLAQVLEWGREVEPPVVVDDVITMDEYTHDALARLPNGRYIAFDTT